MLRLILVNGTECAVPVAQIGVVSFFHGSSFGRLIILFPASSDYFGCISIGNRALVVNFQDCLLLYQFLEFLAGLFWRWSMSSPDHSTNSFKVWSGFSRPQWVNRVQNPIAVHGFRHSPGWGRSSGFASVRQPCCDPRPESGLREKNWNLAVRLRCCALLRWPTGDRARFYRRYLRWYFLVRTNDAPKCSFSITLKTEHLILRIN